MLKLNKKIVKGMWYSFPDDEDIEIKIKPFPFTKNLFEYLNAGKDIETNQVAQAILMFMECVIDWKGLLDGDNVPLKCNKENKEIVFENVPDIVSFVLIKINSDDNKLMKQIKN